MTIASNLMMAGAVLTLVLANLAQARDAHREVEVNPIVQVQVLPYAKMRYPTAGDWQWTHEGRLIITVARMPDPRYEQLLAIHEMSEAWMCKHDGITEKVVDDWDKAHLDADEPGDLPGAPYGAQHKAATELFERQLATKLGVDWPSYEKAINDLGK